MPSERDSAHGGTTAKDARSRHWLVLLLLPHPPLSVAYLMAIRFDHINPSFVPPLLLATLPLVAVALSVTTLLRGPRERRALPIVTLGLGVLELLWALLTLAIVGFGIAWRSG